MKFAFISLFTLFAFAAAVLAEDVTVKLSDVHLCCEECVNGVNRAVAKVEGVKAVANEDAHTVTLTGPDTATVQKAADALVAHGYFGKSDDANVRLTADTGAKGEKVQTLKIEGVHLCCGECVSTVNRALKTVPGVKGHTAKKKATSFEVTGDFNDREVFEALHKAGLNGKATN